MTPAIDLVRRQGIEHRVHRYRHDEQAESWGLEAAQKLGLSAGQVFKTLVVQSESGRLAVGLVPVDARLDLKKMARALGVKKLAMADAGLVQRSTGYVLGGVSPLGQKKRLETVIDASAEALQTLFVSAGRRGLEIELAPADLQRLTGARLADIRQS